jgi:hypothetical protein
MKTLLSYLLPLAALLVLIAAGEIPAVRGASAWIDARRAGLLEATLTVTAVGLVVMIWAWVVVAARAGRPMSDEEAKELAGRPLPLPGQQSFRAGIFRGAARGRTTDQPLEWSFAEMKAAWRAGTWWSDAGMRRKYVITAGGLLLIFGGFATCFVSFQPPAAKLLLGGAVVYAVARTVSSWYRA